MKIKFLLILIVMGVGYNSIAQTITWNGSQSTDWNTSTNWTPQTIPGSGNAVVIGNTGNKPILSSSTSIGSLTLNSGAELTLNATLTVSGNVSLTSSTLSGNNLLSAATIGNDSLTSRVITINNSTVNTPLNIAGTSIGLTNSVFNEKVNFRRYNSTSSFAGTSTNGGNTFAQKFSWLDKAATQTRFGAASGDVFDDTVIVHKSRAAFIFASSSTTTIFNGPLNLQLSYFSTGTPSIQFGESNGSTALINSNVQATITNSGLNIPIPILFGTSNSGTIQMAAGKSMSISNNSWGEIRFQKFEKLGTDSFKLNNTAVTAVISNKSTFNGVVDLNLCYAYLNGGNFKKDVYIKTNFSGRPGAVAVSTGNNRFYENLSIHRVSGGATTYASAQPDTVDGNLTYLGGSTTAFLNSAGNWIKGNLHVDQVGYSFAVNTSASLRIDGNISATNQAFNWSNLGLFFGSNNGYTEFNGTQITLNNGNATSAALTFRNFRKTNPSFIQLNNTSGASIIPIRIENCPEWNGNLTLNGVAFNLIGTTFKGIVKLNRNVNFNNNNLVNQGGNTFEKKLELNYTATGVNSSWTWGASLSDTYLDTVVIYKNHTHPFHFVTNGQAILHGDLIKNDPANSKINLANGTGKLVFSGNKVQNITAVNNKSIPITNIEINKPSNFIAANDTIQITGNLALTNGVFKAQNSAKPIELRQNSSISGGDNFSYIDGYVLNRQNSIKYFPVGHNNRFMPVYSDSVNAALQLKVRYRNENSHLVNSHTNRGSFTDSISTKEYWEVMQNNNPLSNLKLKLSLDTLSLCAFESATDIQAAQTQPTNWNKLTQNGVIPFTDSKVLLKFTLANQASSLIAFAKDSVWCNNGQDDYDWDLETHEFPILPNFNRLFDFRYISGSSIITNDTLQVNGNISAKSTISGLLTSNGTKYSDNHTISIQNVYTLKSIIDTIRNIHGLKINEGAYQVSLNRGVYYLKDYNTALKYIKLIGDSSDYFIFILQEEFKFNEQLKFEFSNIDPNKIIFYSFSPILVNKVVLPGVILSSSSIEYRNTYVSSNAFCLKSISFNDIKSSQIPISFRFVKECKPNPCNTGLYNGNFQEISFDYNPSFIETLKDPFGSHLVCGWEAFSLHPNLSINPSLPQVSLTQNNAVTNTTNNYAVMWAGLNNEHESLISTSRFHIQASVQYTFTCSLRYNSNQQFSNLITQINGNPLQEMFRFLFVLTDFDSNFSPYFTDLGEPSVLQYPAVPAGNNFYELIASPSTPTTDFTNNGWQIVSITFTPDISIPNARLYISPRINAGALLNNFTVINQQQSGSFPAIYAEIDDISISGLTTDNLIYSTNVTNLWNNISFVTTNFLTNTNAGSTSNTINNNWIGNNFNPTSNHIIVNGSIIVNSGEVLNINNSHLAFPSTSSIVVNGGTLNISNSWLHGCDFLWSGITVLNGGHVNIVKSHVEDALVGLSSLSILNPSQQGTYSILNSFFNKNRIHISVTNANNPGTISSTTFSSSDLTLKANINETHDSRTQIAIRLRSVNNFQLNPTVGQENIFTEAYFGIYSTNSTFNINNNIFRNIDCTNYKGPGFDCSNIYGTVYSSSNLNGFAGGSAAIAVLNLPNYSTNTVSNISNSRFSNIQFGVVMDNPLSINLHKNTFNRISYHTFSDFQSFPMDRAGTAILSRNMGSNRMLNITENRFNNAENSISIGPNYNSNITINNNVCNYVFSPNQSNIFSGQTRAIRVYDDNITPFSLIISNNNITFYDHGIIVSNLGSNTLTTLISNNQITLNTSSSNLNKIGINIVNCSGKSKNVINNNVTGNSTIPSLRYIGYQFNNSSLSSILCNTAENTFTGFSFFGVCQTFFGRNTINDGNRAINLRNAVIGHQGTPLTNDPSINPRPRLNSWIGNFNFHFYAEDLTNGTNSNFVLNTWNNPLYNIGSLLSNTDNPLSTAVTISTTFQQSNFEALINNGCIISGGGLDISENESSAFEMIKLINDTLYSNTFKNDLAFHFLNQYESDTVWQNITEAALLFDSLSNSLLGNLYQIQKSLNHWPNIDNVLGNTNVSALFTNFKNEILTKINQLDSLHSQDAYFVNLIDVFKLQASKLVFDTDKVLFYESFNQLSVDSLLQIFESDSLLNFKLDSSTLNKMETLATSSAKENGNSVYQARSILDTDFLIDEFYLNPLELPSNQSNFRLSNIVENEDKNLVKNGSFEEMYDCPTNFGQLNKAKHWSSPNRGYGYESIEDTTDYYYIQSTPDLFALCNNYNSSITPIPINDINVEPYDGVNFALIFINHKDIVNYFPFYSSDSCFAREYIQGSLKNTLTEGKKYIFSFKICLSKSRSCKRITNKLSIYFSSDSLSEFSDLCGYTPQIVTNTYFDKNDEWMFYQSEYIANGSENYFSIGIFLPNDNLELIDNPLCEWPHSFVDNSLIYLFDDVRLECADENGCGLVSNGDEISSQKLTIFPNPASQLVNLTFSEPFNKALTYSITDLQGRQLLQGGIQNQETVLDISNLSKGIYLLNISDAQGNKWNKKIIKGE